MSAHAVGALGAVVAILVLLQYAEAQKQHVVGGDQGWKFHHQIQLCTKIGRKPRIFQLEIF